MVFDIKSYQKEYYRRPEVRKRKLISSRKYYLKNKEARTEYQKEWRANNPEKVRTYGKRGREKNKEKLRIRRQKYYGRMRAEEKEKEKFIRLECFNEYGRGELKCVCCGENMVDFLTLDHILNDGYKERKEGAKRRMGGICLYKFLKKRGYPRKNEFQLLCYNCNCAKKFTGVCPHKQMEEM